MWQPWMGHFFHLGPNDMIELSLEQYVEMYDSRPKGKDA